MPSYKITAVLEPAGSSSIGFNEPVEINEIKLWSENLNNGSMPRIYAEREFETEQEMPHPQLERIAYSKIETEVLPVIVLLSDAPYRIADIKIERLPEVKSTSKSVEVRLFDAIKPTDEDINIIKIFGNAHAEISRINDNLKKIGLESRSIFLRSLKYWNRAMSDPDPIDRFINLYIALELLKGLLLRKEPSKKKREWVNTLHKKYNFNKFYEGYKIHDIRAALLHYKNERLSKEEAERIIEKHVDEFAQEIFRLMKDYVECGGDTECLQKKRQPKSRS